MRIAVGQFAPGADKTENIERIAVLTIQAHRDGAEVAAEPRVGNFVDSLIRLTYRLGIKVVAGMVETIPGDQRVYNTAVVVDPRDGLVATHRKRYLYDAFGEKESERFVAGVEDPPILEIGGFKAAVVICYEIRFPAHIQQLADRGADLLLVPAAWVAGPLKEEHWTTMVRARAMENTMYVAGAGMGGAGYCARSMLVDPLGVVISGLGEAEGVVVGEVTQERLAAARAKLPLVEQRRVGSAIKV